jgi:peptidoglycan/LPS O-acetylase OafA/YrhL
MVFGWLGGFYLCLLIVAQSGGILTRVLELAPIRYVGRISYGLYLYHWPIFLLVAQIPWSLNGTLVVLITLALTAVVAVASYKFIEQPLLQIKDRLFPPISRRPIGMPQAIIMPSPAPSAVPARFGVGAVGES